MNKKNIIECILLKVLSIVIILLIIVVLSYLFSNSYIYDLTLLSMIFVGIIALLPLFWCIGILMSTNNPNTRFNVFSINHKWMQRSNQITRFNLFGLSPADPNYHQKKQRHQSISSILK